MAASAEENSTLGHDILRPDGYTVSSINLVLPFAAVVDGSECADTQWVVIGSWGMQVVYLVLHLQQPASSTKSKSIVS
jgi:hypothetical protein